MDFDVLSASECLLQDLPSRSLTSNDTSIQILPRSTANTAGVVISKIEDIFDSIIDCIHHKGKELSIPLKTRGKAGNQSHDATSGAILSLPDTKIKTITFPSRIPREAWKFTALLRILELSHEALVNGVITTKRDIYYRDPELFVKQAVVDRYVDDLAYTFGVERDALNVVAAAKGLIAGYLKITRKDASIMDFVAEPEGALVPSLKELHSIQVLDVRWILVVEKEATFRRLMSSQYWKNSLAGKGILVTAKGYPDIQTRRFLSLISDRYPQIPILALVDFDPDGIGILSTYKYGSIALAHQNESLAVPGIRWIGVGSSDIINRAETQGLLKLTARDRKMAMRMLDKKMFQGDGPGSEWRRELQVMLMLNVKAEIQILSDMDGLESWLDGKLRHALV